MDQDTTTPDDQLAPKEREAVRLAFYPSFSQPAALSEGIYLRTWRTGERRGQPKIPPGVQSMLDRGLVEIRAGNLLGARAVFTPTGLDVLRRTVREHPRFLSRKDFSHVLDALEAGGTQDA